MRQFMRIFAGIILISNLYAATPNDSPSKDRTQDSNSKIDSKDLQDSHNSKATQAIQDSHTQPHTTNILSPVVITSKPQHTIHAPSQLNLYGRDTPLHSGDIAQSMLLLPGFSMVRKGGAGSEVLFRSQGASRLPIFLSGGVLNGACGGRMDTTTTYTFPENYDKITILRGPQDVRYGGLIAGGMLFERTTKRLQDKSSQGHANVRYGGFNRLDLNANALAGNQYGSLQAIISHYSSDDYKSGGGALVHSAYNRQSASIIGTLTPTQDSALEVDIDMGRGFASYADRTMDARTFDRASYNLKYEHKFSGTLNFLDIRAWYNGIDHIMDNFSHRPVEGNYHLSNPKRTNIGGRIETKWSFDERLELLIGGGYNHDLHSIRTGSGTDQAGANAALKQDYKPNYRFMNLGLFAQGSYALNHDGGIFFGARYDYMGAHKQSTQEMRHNHLGSGFLRYEHYWDMLSAFIGLGVAQRSPDFWEYSKSGGMALRPETNTQLDMGVHYSFGEFMLRANAFASFIADYIVLHYGTITSALNTNAMLIGGELEAEYTFLDSLHLYGSLAYTYGMNLRDRISGADALLAYAPLPQIAPLQGMVSLFYDNNAWLLRFDAIFHAAQSRYAKDFGNVIGRDFGRSEGFGIMNLYGGYRLKKVGIFAGIDNIADTRYSYHLSKSGVDIGAIDIAATSRIYEPGRSIWAKIKVEF